MYDLKTILLAKRFRRNLDITHLTIADIAMLEIIKNKTASNPVRDATISNGTAYFDRVTASQPLVSLLLNIPVTQTGSGTPSPTNIRDFIGFSGVNIGQTSGYGEYFRGLLNGTYGFVDLGSLTFGYNTTYSAFYASVSNIYRPSDVAGRIIGFINLRYPASTNGAISAMDDKSCLRYNGNFWIKDTSFTDATAIKTSLNGIYLIYELAEPSTPITSQDFAILCQAFGITGNTYTISFGQTVYSAILDVLTGKLYLIHELKTIDENSDITMSNGIVVLDNFFDIDNDTESVNCNVYQRGENRSNTSNVMANNPDYSFCGKNGGYATRLMIKDTRFETLEDYKTWLSTNPVKIAVKLAEPIEIQLTPTIINTLIGENVIFADVADVTECKYTRK